MIASLETSHDGRADTRRMPLVDVFNLFGEQDWDGENGIGRDIATGRRRSASGSVRHFSAAASTSCRRARKPADHYEIGCEELADPGLGPA